MTNREDENALSLDRAKATMIAKKECEERIKTEVVTDPISATELGFLWATRIFQAKYYALEVGTSGEDRPEAENLLAGIISPDAIQDHLRMAREPLLATLMEAQQGNYRRLKQYLAKEAEIRRVPPTYVSVFNGDNEYRFETSDPFAFNHFPFRQLARLARLIPEEGGPLSPPPTPWTPESN